MLRPALTLAAAVLVTTSLRAHPELAGALSRLNPAIAAAPADAALYLERGELYAKYGDAVSAEANFLRASELAPRLPRLDRALGALALSTRQPAEALAHLDRALALDARDAEALILRSRALTALGRGSAALADFDAAVALVPNPRPELFLEYAALLPSPAAAIVALDAAIARIGPAYTLHLRALELEETSGRIDAALTRLATLAALSERKETWLKRRGDLLARAGRTAEARVAYTTALAAVDALPDWLRASPDTARLAVELRTLCAPNS
ncbi:MAG TPA: tetratricopeptide repeat protein [Opitutaceae bacterium]